MAFTVTTRGTNNNGTTAGATIAVGAFTPTADSLLLFYGHCETNNGTNVDPTVSDPTGITMTLVVKLDGADAVLNAFEVTCGLYRAAIGSPSSTTITWDGTNDAAGGWYTAGALDITGHNVASPVVQSKATGTNHAGGSGNPSHSVTLDTTPTTGSLVVVAFSASGDPTGSTDMASPTIGGQSMTKVQGNAPNAYEHHAVFYREITGAETDKTITTSGIGGTGSTVFKAIGVAVEVAAAGPPASLMFLAPTRSALRPA